jgi:hypothetical protein
MKEKMAIKKRERRKEEANIEKEESGEREEE